MTPLSLMPQGIVLIEPVGSNVMIVPSAARTNPCVLTPSLYEPVTTPVELTAVGSVFCAPGTASKTVNAIGFSVLQDHQRCNLQLLSDYIIAAFNHQVIFASATTAI